MVQEVVAVKIRINKDEWYPVYYVSDYSGHPEIELSAEDFASWKAAEVEFANWNSKIGALVREVEARREKT